MTRIHSRYQKAVAGGLLCLLGIAASGSSLAGEFTVTPVRVYMTPKDRATAITITNEGNEELVMQADLFRWEQQPGGKDELTPTEEIFLAPPIIKMAPRSQQVLRLARVGPLKQSGQVTYRMIVREIPEARAPKEGSLVQVALAFSIPVFITPAGAKAKFGCTVERVGAETVKAVCENTGNAHIHPTSLLLSSNTGDMLAREDNGGYLLSGTKRSFELKRNDGKIPAGKAALEVSFADGTTQKYDIGIAE